MNQVFMLVRMIQVHSAATTIKSQYEQSNHVEAHPALITTQFTKIYKTRSTFDPPRGKVTESKKKAAQTYHQLDRSSSMGLPLDLKGPARPSIGDCASPLLRRRQVPVNGVVPRVRYYLGRF